MAAVPQLTLRAEWQVPAHANLSHGGRAIVYPVVLVFLVWPCGSDNAFALLSAPSNCILIKMKLSDTACAVSRVGQIAIGLARWTSAVGHFV